jgi:Na+-transporting NADH:ubiquinone oxidoreductase subunit F
MVVLLAVIVFVVVILALSFGLIFARKRLVPQGDVKIIINGDEENPMLVQPGSSLLSALSDKNIFLPSACGGGGPVPCANVMWTREVEMYSLPR